MTNISLHNTTEIKISKIREGTIPSGEVYFTKKFSFIDEDGNKVELTAFAKSKDQLKSK